MKPVGIGILFLGVVMLILGTVFALQGNGTIGGSNLMDGNKAFIYIGTIVAVVGLASIIRGLRLSMPRNNEKNPQRKEIEQ